MNNERERDIQERGETETVKQEKKDKYRDETIKSLLHGWKVFT